MHVADPSRRRALLSAAAAAIALLPPLRALASPNGNVAARFASSRAATLRVGIALPRGGEHDAFRRGSELGFEELSRTAQLLGARIELVVLPDPGEDADSLSTEFPGAARPNVLLGGGDESSAGRLSRYASRHGLLFLNIGADADSLRSGECRRTTFHVAPSARMKADARRIADLAADHPVVAWHPALERFGAGQLSARYEARFGSGIGSAAWCAWAGLKIAGEAWLRTRSTDAHVLAAHLDSPRTRFDVHKGIPVSFRPWDHQLRQPLYLVDLAAGEPGRVVAEVPQPRDAAGRSWKDLLDALGGPPSTTPCSGST